MNPVRKKGKRPLKGENRIKIANPIQAETSGSLEFDYHLTPGQVYITREASYPSTATFTIAITNGTDNDQEVEGIFFQFSIGTGMFDLSSDGSSIKATSFQESTWTISGSDGNYKVVPVNPSTKLGSGETITFQLENVIINKSIGTAIIMVGEELSTTVTNTGQIQINKVQSSLDILTFSASPASIAPGGKTTLSWTTQAATGVSLTPGSWNDLQPNDSRTVSPSQTTTYTLVATGDGPNVSKQFAIEVTKVGISSFMADPPINTAGADTKLSWTTENADSVSLVPGNFSNITPNDSVTVNPTKSEIFTLTAYNKNKTDQAQQQLTVTIAPVAILSFSADNNGPVDAGTEVTLSWDTQYANSWKIEAVSNGVNLPTLSVGGDKGSVKVNPKNTTKYTLVCDGYGPEQSQSLTVDVNSVTITEFTVNPTSVKLGDEATLSWKTKRATSVKLSTSNSNQLPSGSLTVKPTNNTKYTLTCQGPNGPVSKSVTLGTNHVKIITLYGVCVDTQENCAWMGATIQVDWKTQNATSTKLYNSANQVVATKSGTFTFHASYTLQTFKLVAEGPGGSVTKSMSWQYDD